VERKRIAIFIIENYPASFLSSVSSEFPILNKMIKEGNTTRFIRRKDTNFLLSILGLTHIDTLKDIQYKQLFNGMDPFVMSNDSTTLEILKKYNISHRPLPVEGFAVIKAYDVPECEPHNPMITHINCEHLATKLTYVFVLLTASIQYFSPIRRIYTIMYPFKIAPEAILPKPIFRSLHFNGDSSTDI